MVHLFQYKLFYKSFLFIYAFAGLQRVKISEKPFIKKMIFYDRQRNISQGKA